MSGILSRLSVLFREPKTFLVHVKWREINGLFIGEIEGIINAKILGLSFDMLNSELLRYLERWREVRGHPRARFDISFEEDAQ